jgi:predicted SAM-dependent methyltransferase
MKKDNKLNYLNIGCGNRFHPQWLNIDMVSYHPDVVQCNILNGLPFGESEFEVVYHSHVLEHFRQPDGKKFIEECYRVLKPEGIIRIAIPDLEKIVRTYLQKLDGALAGNAGDAIDYQWIMLELYDQTMRDRSGGAIRTYLEQEQIPNEGFVFSQVGEEARILRNYLMQQKNRNDFKTKMKTMIRQVKDLLKRIPFYRYYTLGKFRNSGEIHYWMYDRYSLSALLKEVGFTNVTVQQATTSSIPDWNMYELDARNGITHKPDSLFIEAKKR